MELTAAGQFRTYTGFPYPYFAGKGTPTLPFSKIFAVFFYHCGRIVIILRENYSK